MEGGGLEKKLNTDGKLKSIKLPVVCGLFHSLKLQTFGGGGIKHSCDLFDEREDIRY